MLANKYAIEHNSPGFKMIGTERDAEILMQYLVANVFVLGANAITMDGQLSMLTEQETGLQEVLRL